MTATLNTCRKIVWGWLFSPTSSPPTSTAEYGPLVDHHLHVNVGHSSRDQDLLATQPPAQLSTAATARDGGGRSIGCRTAGGFCSQRGHGWRCPILVNIEKRLLCKYTNAFFLVIVLRTTGHASFFFVRLFSCSNSSHRLGGRHWLIM